MVLYLVINVPLFGTAALCGYLIKGENALAGEKDIQEY